MLTLLAMAAAAHAAAPAPSVTRRVLPSGLTVVVRQDASVGVMAASLHVRAGSLFETADTAGITNFLHRVMMRGTSRYTAVQLTAAIDDLGRIAGCLRRRRVRRRCAAPRWPATPRRCSA